MASVTAVGSPYPLDTSTFSHTYVLSSSNWLSSSAGFGLLWGTSILFHQTNGTFVDVDQDGVLSGWPVSSLPINGIGVYSSVPASLDSLVVGINRVAIPLAPMSSSLGKWAYAINVSLPALLRGNDDIYGSDNGDRLFGFSGADEIFGYAGDDLIDGGPGSDSLRGGTGDDTYAVDRTDDVIVELPDEGNDVVRATASFTLPDNVERLVLLGSRHIDGSGNALDNGLDGNAGDNLLDGAAGADLMEGGMGDDTYVVENPLDQVVEALGRGLDTVRSFIDYTLGPNVENLILVGAAAINGTGNALDNFLNGALNDGANVLTGGLGNDTYEIGAGDTVIELPGEGLDTLRSDLLDVVLPDNIENVVLHNANASVTGNDVPNAVTGSSGDNTLDGGRGPDSLAGLTGDDTYIVDSSLDVVTEALSGGIDEIVCVVSITLPANVENGTAAPGTSVVALTGNGLNNVLTGNDGANLLDGGAGNDTLLGQGGLDVLLGGDGNDLLAGGPGIDVLLGGAGADRFRFDAAPSGTNVDRIMDFAPGTDDLEFSAAVFGGLGAAGGPVTPDAFVKGPDAVALGPEDRLLYDTSAGQLFYDPDGTGPNAPALLATLQGAPNLGTGDLLVVA